MDFIDLKTQYASNKANIDQHIQRVLEHGQYIMGPEVSELEARLAAYVGVKHAIGVASGTDALLIAMMALGISTGDEVITTPFSFIATAETIALLGARPVFVDVEPHTLNLAPDLIEQAITSRTKAIMPVSLYGQCADFDRINIIAERHGIAVIEDGCQSFGATYKGKRSCGLTTVGCTSFFPSKPLGCYGDGGACFTNDDGLAKAMREIRVHGQDRRYHHPRIGINGRLDTIQAAVLLAKMEFFPEEVEKRNKIGDKYNQMISASCSYIELPHVEAHNTSVYAQYTIQIEGRDALQHKLKELGIPTAIHYPTPLHLQPAFANLGQNEGMFPVAELAAKRVISLPMHSALLPDMQRRIVDSLQ